MSGYPPIPAPTPALIAILRDLMADEVGDRISISLDRVLPALRVAKTGDQAPPSEWEAVPMYQIEVWHEDELEAERIAWHLKNVWTSATLRTYGSAAVHGRWVVQDPLHLPANDDEAKTDLARYLVTVAFRLTGVSNG